MSALKMLQRFRDYFPSWLVITLLVLMAILIVFPGLYSSLSGNLDIRNTPVISIRNKKINRATFERQYQSLKRQYQLELGKKFRKSTSFERTLQMQALSMIVNQEVLQQRLYQQGYRIHPKNVLKTLHQIVAFQENGQFSSKLFQKLIALEGYTNESFLSNLTKEKLINQNRQAIIKSVFSTKNEIQNTKQLVDQIRNFEYLEIPADFFITDFNQLTKDEIRQYYDRHLSEFRVPEQVSIDYIVVSLKDVVASLKAKPSQIDPAKFKTQTEEEFSRIIQLISQLSDTQPTTLEPIAKSLKLHIRSTELFDRSGGKVAIARFPEVVATAFSQDVLKGYNSPVISIDTNRVVVLRLKHYQPLQLANFESSQIEAAQKLRLEKSKEKVIKTGKALTQKLKSHPIQNVTLPYALHWTPVRLVKRYSKAIPSRILNAAFKIPYIKEQLNVIDFVTPDDNYAIICLLSVQDAPLSDNSMQSDYPQDVAAIANQTLEYDLYVQKNLKRTSPFIKQLH